MERKRFYFNIENFKDDEIIITDDEFHHMVNVMRLRVNDEVVLFCGNGKDYFATIKSISKKEAVCSVCEVKDNLTETGLNLTIFQALVKGEKLALITQKLTEIGVNEIAVFESKYCDVKSNTTKLDKLNKVVIGASKQCGRSVLMKTNNRVLTFKELLESIKKYDAVLLAYENENCKTLSDYCKKLSKTAKIAIIIGPEGGFDKKEVENLSGAGAEVVSLGKRILRTETAAIFMASVIIGSVESL